jgi:formylmethanofuran dehydrogenase subunit E
VPDHVVIPLVVKIMNAPAEMIMVVSEVFEFNWNEPKHSFNSIVCEKCGEMVIEEYTKTINGKKVCMDCVNK